MLWHLFVVFMKVGFLSFGGGYAVMPIIQHEIQRNNWMTGDEFERIVALAGMSPGPIATNSATLVGYQLGGISGAVVSTAGIVLPSLLLMVGIAAFMYRIHNNLWVRSSFYGLRPIVASLIMYAAIHFAGMMGGETLLTWSTIATLLICAGAVIGVLKYKLHPLTIIIASGLAGIILF